MNNKSVLSKVNEIYDIWEQEAKSSDLVRSEVPMENLAVLKRKSNKTISLSNDDNWHGVLKRVSSAGQEWHNSVYSYNKNYIKLLTTADKSLFSLMKRYFNSYQPRLIKRKKLLRLKKLVNKRVKVTRPRDMNRRYYRKRRDFIKARIFIAKNSVKHTSNSAIISLFIFNRERHTLMNIHFEDLDYVLNIIHKHKFSFIRYKKRQYYRKKNLKILSWKENLAKLYTKKVLTVVELKTILLRLCYKIEKPRGFTHLLFRDWHRIRYDHFDFFQNKGRGEATTIRNSQRLFKKLRRHHRFIYAILFNQAKFEKSFIENIRRLASRLYNKNVTFNFVNLRKYYLNSSIYSQMVTIHLKNRQLNISEVLSKSFNLIKVPKVSKMRIVQYVNRGKLWLNQTNHNLVFDLLTKTTQGGHWFEHILYKYNNPVVNPFSWFGFFMKDKLIREDDQMAKFRRHLKRFKKVILKTVKDKTLAGVRVEIRGRLTKRFKAARSVYRLKWIGGLRNINSSYKGFSVGMLRGHALPNVEYTVMSSKRRIGAFGVKGWVSSL